ncbi:hypothetical protein B0H10DRAFT_1967483 [Mycena sp. CBHHK59/15]|nr:hypothetical protein B0H10DRAFT_1967483 [Mycena sp. CBHHK59/15]
MRKKDRRPHKPVLKRSTCRTILHTYLTLLRLFVAVVTAIISFTANPYTIFAVKLVAANAAVKAETAAFTLVLYLLQNFPGANEKYSIIGFPIYFLSTRACMHLLDIIAHTFRTCAWTDCRDTVIRTRTRGHINHKVSADDSNDDEDIPDLDDLDEMSDHCESDKDEDEETTSHLRHKLPWLWEGRIG